MQRRTAQLKMQLMQLRKETLKKFGRLATNSNRNLFYISAVCCKVCSHYYCHLAMLLPTLGLLRIKPHFFPTVSQLEFSFHFLEGVQATFTVR